jgi:hypothetical protein
MQYRTVVVLALTVCLAQLIRAQEEPQPVGSYQTPTSNQNGRNVASEDIARAIKVTAIPRVSVESVKDWTDRAVWIFSGLLVIVGFFQVWILMRQTSIINASLLETQRATELTRQSLVLTQRPKIIVRDVSTTADPLDAPSHGIDGTIQILNSGNTPAHLLFITCDPYLAAKLPMGIPYNMKMGKRDPVPVLPPGIYTIETFSWQPPSGDDPFGYQRYAGIRNGNWNIYVMGQIVYADDLGNQRATRFCRVYDRARGRFFPAQDAEYEGAD